MTMLVVTHEMAFARDVSNHVVYMADGVICEEAVLRIFLKIRRMQGQRFLGQIPCKIKTETKKEK